MPITARVLATAIAAMITIPILGIFYGADNPKFDRILEILFTTAIVVCGGAVMVLIWTT